MRVRLIGNRTKYLPIKFFMKVALNRHFGSKVRREFTLYLTAITTDDRVTFSVAGVDNKPYELYNRKYEDVVTVRNDKYLCLNADTLLKICDIIEEGNRLYADVFTCDSGFFIKRKEVVDETS